MVKHLPKPLRSRAKKQWLNTLQSSAAKKNRGAKTPTNLHVVIDTNVWYSAVVHGGNAEQVVLYCLDNAEIVLSSEIVDELHNLFRNFLKVPYRWLNAFIRPLDDICEAHESRNDITIDSDIRDPKDMHVIAAAIHHNCDLIITGDKDLLELHTKSIQIMAIADFLELIRHN